MLFTLSRLEAQGCWLAHSVLSWENPRDTKLIHAAGACDQRAVPLEVKLLAASADHQSNSPLKTQFEDCHLQQTPGNIEACSDPLPDQRCTIEQSSRDFWEAEL
ncbi:MAG: hypothetical protein FRX49_01156 [Trebouxia sp. A1-2]|nr:MAG: hypothetical protein FRX49_01156 [Trebouxia sp. A1-2]